MTLKGGVTVSATLSNQCATGFSGSDNITQLDIETQTNWHENHNYLAKFSLMLLEASCNLLHHATASFNKKKKKTL